MPNICDGYHGLEPMRSDQPEGPWFTMSADQIRAIANFVEGSSRSFRIEYRGAGYWNAMELDTEGAPTEKSRMIFALER